MKGGGGRMGSGVRPPGKLLGSHPLDFRKTPFLNTEVRPSWIKMVNEIIDIAARNCNSFYNILRLTPEHSFK